MKMLKKIVSVLLTAVLGCCLVCSCNNEQQTGEDELIVVGVSQVGAESDWRIANTESINYVFTEENGYRLLFDDAKQMQDNQLSAVRKYIQQKVDYIVIMPIAEEGWDAVLQEAKDAGIPVIIVDRMVNVSDDDLFTAHVGADFYLEGQKATEWMEDEFAEDDAVNIIHLQGTLGSTAQIGRTQALEDALAVHDNWNLLAQFDCDFTQAKAYELIRDYIINSDVRPEIDVVYCENDNMAFGAIEALEKYGYTCGEGGVAVISFDATKQGLEVCMEGKISLDVECNPMLGPLVENVIETIEAGGVPEKYQYVEETVFTPDMLTQELIDSRDY